METATTLAGSSENVAGHEEGGVMSEVYAVTREFTEWGRGVYNRLPPRFRDGLRAAGVCHYVVIVKDTSGGLYSFDFGPVGGDVTGKLAGGRLLFDKSTSSPSLLGLAKKEEEKEDSEAEEGVVKTGRRFSSVDDLNTAASASFEKNTSSFFASNHEDVAAAEDSSSSAAAASGASSSPSPARRGDRLRSLRSSISFKGGRAFLSRANGVRGGGRTSTAGEIREARLDALPEGHHFVGHTRLSLEDIREFNAARDTAYSLHANDCRHYLNDLCAHACPEVCGPGSASVRSAAAGHAAGQAAGPGSGSESGLGGGRYGKYGLGGVASHVAWQNTLGRLRSGRAHEALHLIPLQAITDLSNLNTINRIKSACSASVVFGVGMRALPLLCRPVLGALPVASAVSLPGATKIGVAAAAGAGHRPARRLVTTAAGAVAGVSAEVPVVREALMVGNMALTGFADVARGVVAGTSSVITAGVGLFASSTPSVSSSASAVSSATAAAACSYSVTASATCEATVAASGASMVAAGTSRYGAGAAAATAIASSYTYQSSAVYAGTAAVAAAQTHVVSAQAALAAGSVAVTKMATSASEVKAVAGRAARATQTIVCAVGAGLKKITPYPRGGWGGGSSASPRVAAKRLSPQKQQQQQRRLSAGLLPSWVNRGKNANAGGRGGGGKVPRPSEPRLSLRSDAALELRARAQRPRPVFSLRRRDRATTVTAAATMAISA